MSKSNLLACFVVTVVLGSATVGYGATIVLDAVEDTYGRSGANTAVNNGLGILQSRTGNTSTANRGIIQFNLNQPALIGGTITSAFMQYYQLPITSPAATPSFAITNSQILLSTSTLAGFDDATMTYSQYLASYDLDSVTSPLGNITRSDATPSDVNNSYLVGDTTSDPVALSNLQGRLDKPNAADRFTVMLLLSGSAQTRLFDDREGGHPIQLVINYTPAPEPSTFVLGGLGAAAIGLVAWRRRRVAS